MAVVRWQVQGASADTIERSPSGKDLDGKLPENFFFSPALKSLHGFAKFQQHITKFGLP